MRRQLREEGERAGAEAGDREREAAGGGGSWGERERGRAGGERERERERWSVCVHLCVRRRARPVNGKTSVSSERSQVAPMNKTLANYHTSNQTN